jgi:hypothetical protein
MGNSEAKGFANERQRAVDPSVQSTQTAGRVLMGIGTLGISEGVIAACDAQYTQKDFPRKYKPCDFNGRHWDQLSCGLFGSCIKASAATSGMKARSGNNGLSGIVADGNNTYKYFLANGALVSTYEFTIPPQPGTELKRKVKDFLQQPGNNKLLYLSGHGDKNGCWSANDVSLSPFEIFGWLSDAGFCGQFTLFVDACYSGKIAKRFKSAVEGNSESSQPLRGIELAAFEQGRKTYINLRLSSLSNETSADAGPSMGGSYSHGYLRRLRLEHVWTREYVGDGWGTKIMVARPPDDSDTVWSTSNQEAQTDLIADFVFDPSSRGWTWHFPKKLKDYL